VPIGIVTGTKKAHYNKTLQCNPAAQSGGIPGELALNAQSVSQRASDPLTKTHELAVQFEGAEASAALTKAAAWLTTLRARRGFTLDERYVSIDLVDTSTRAHQQHIVDDYLVLTHTRRAQEKVLWEAAHGFCVALSGAYIDCIAAAQSDAAAALKFRSKLPVLAARGALAIGMQIKWIAFRYGLVEPWVWSNLARCLRFAEANDMADRVVPLYLSSKTPLSTQQTFTRAVMLHAADTEALSLMEQEIVSRFIDHFTDRFKFDRRADENLTLYFDLNHALPPRRVLGVPVRAAQRRFFSALDALPMLEQYRARVVKGGIGAAPISLPRGAHVKEVVKVLDHLALHWAKPMPARAHERRLTTGCLEIRHDYRSVFEALEAGPADVSVTASIARGETWVVDNAGRGGYSAIVPKGQRPWLAHHVLIALRLEHEARWSLGLIRRVETDEHRQRKVGIRVIARKPVAASLRLAQVSGKRVREESGIVLNTRPSSNGGVHVLTRSGMFTLQEEIVAAYGANREFELRLKPTNAMEATLDYAWVRYEVVG